MSNRYPSDDHVGIRATSRRHRHFENNELMMIKQILDKHTKLTFQFLASSFRNLYRYPAREAAGRSEAGETEGVEVPAGNGEQNSLCRTMKTTNSLNSILRNRNVMDHVFRFPPDGSA